MSVRSLYLQNRHIELILYSKKKESSSNIENSLYQPPRAVYRELMGKICIHDVEIARVNKTQYHIYVSDEVVVLFE